MQIRASQVVLVVKNPSVNAGDLIDAGLIPRLGRSFGGGHGKPLQYPCLENPMDRRAWRSTVSGVTKSQTGLKHISMQVQIALQSLSLCPDPLSSGSAWTKDSDPCSVPLTSPCRAVKGLYLFGWKKKWTLFVNYMSIKLKYKVGIVKYFYFWKNGYKIHKASNHHTPIIYTEDCLKIVLRALLW